MPLYTYVFSYQGEIYVGQDRRSNFKGFAPGMLPPTALPAITPTLRQEMARRLYGAEWTVLANRTHVWTTSFDLGGKRFTLCAVQTQS
jgi:hypothetical protein